MYESREFGAMPILADAQRPSLSIPPGTFQMQDGVPSIGATVPVEPLAARVNNLQDGPTVVVPRSN